MKVFFTHNIALLLLVAVFELTLAGLYRTNLQAESSSNNHVLTRGLSKNVAVDNLARVDGGQVTLRIRTINASSVIDPVANNESDESSEKQIDARLKDLSSNFQALPYDKFTLRSSEQVDVALRKRSSIRMPDGHTLTFRVLYLNEKRLGLWLDWVDEMGMQVLNSKVHLNCKAPFLVGTDNVKGGGLLLAVAAEH